MQQAQPDSIPEAASGLERRGVTMRAIAIGLGVALFIQGWGIFSSRVIRSSGVTAGFLSPALFIAILLVLFVLNPFLRRVVRSAGLSLAEILTIFAMGLMGRRAHRGIVRFYNHPVLSGHSGKPVGRPSSPAPALVGGAPRRGRRRYASVQRAAGRSGRDSLGGVGGSDVLVGASVLRAGVRRGVAFGNSPETMGGTRAAAIPGPGTDRGDGLRLRYGRAVAEIRPRKAVLVRGGVRVRLHLLECAALDLPRLSRDAGSGAGVRLLRARYAPDVQLYRSVYVRLFVFRESGRSVQRVVLLRRVRAGIRHLQPAGLQHRRSRRPVRLL